MKTAAKKVGFLKRLRDNVKNEPVLYIMLLPILFYFIFFKYVPMFGTVIAFEQFRFADGILGSQWVGLQHFKQLFASPDFYRIFFNTMLLNIYNIVFGFPVPIILALLLNEIRCTPFKRTVQSILYIPHFISWVVLGGIIISMFSAKGVINHIIENFGGNTIGFLTSNVSWVIVYVFSGIWQSAGWGTIVYMAAITGIDPEIYEVAELDGAGRFRRMVSITLPMIKGTAAVMLILKMGRMMEVGFEQIYALQNDAVRSVSEVFSTYEYRLGLEGMQYSYTTALGLFKGIVGLIIVTLTNKAVNLMGEEGLW